MEFDSIDDAWAFYKDYAHSIGFETRKRSSNKVNSKCHKVDEVNYVYFHCSLSGFRKDSELDPKNKGKFDQTDRTKVRDETRCGCKAEMRVKFVESKGSFMISLWEFKHTHDLIPPPQMRRYFRSKRQISEPHRQIAKMHDSVGIRVRDSYDMMAALSGGIESLGFTRSDLATFVRALRSSHVEEGGEKFLQDWFHKESSRDPGFVYEFQYDEEDNIESIFWADTRKQFDYRCFGDSISFDTTYRTNNTYRPLALFAGLNHHRKLVIFAGCLMFEETTRGFMWVFETFLACMKNKHPETIFTDQCPAIAAAIRIVLPNTYHGLCTFHIFTNAKDRLKTSMYEGILSDLQNLMYNVDDEATFDRYWKLTIEKHFPGKGEFGHPWLQFIHKFRQQWSSAWVNNHFTCGMRSSQLSETLNSNLRKFLDTKCNLHQFFTQFNRLLQGKRADELQMDYHSKIAQAPSRYIKHPHIEQA
ncbi:Protein FAR1-RELATED SEQUENCE 5, partial [Linum perenne]